MKLVMDEKLKHRLIGVAVILSIATIFTPAIVKKSTQRFEPKVSMSVKLPPKPLIPKVVKKEEKELLETTRVAEVELPAITEESQLPQLAQADEISISQTDTGPTELIPQSRLTDFEMASSEMDSESIQSRTEEVDAHTQSQELSSTTQAQNNTLDESSTVQASNTSNEQLIEKAKPSVSKNVKVAINKPKKISKKSLAKSSYAIQLASFSRQKNAASLINTLKKQGYSARITKVKVNKGHMYKVHVGHMKNRKDAEKLKSQLAANFKIKGFIVSSTGVS